MHNEGISALHEASRDEAIWGVEIKLFVVCTSTPVGSEWLASRPCRFTSGGKSPHYLLNRRLGGPQRRSRRFGENKIL
jgi:hypothetical protein